MTTKKKKMTNSQKTASAWYFLVFVIGYSIEQVDAMWKRGIILAWQVEELAIEGSCSRAVDPNAWAKMMKDA